MTREQYVKTLYNKGYKIINNERVSLGTLIFYIHEGNRKTAIGTQHTFWLILSPESDLNLAPNPWNLNFRRRKYGN